MLATAAVTVLVGPCKSYSNACSMYSMYSVILSYVLSGNKVTRSSFQTDKLCISNSFSPDSL